MRLGGGPESDNFEDRTGQSGGGFGFGGGGGNALGCLLPMVASRFGIGGVVVLVIGYFLLSSLGGLGGGGGGGGLVPGTQQSAPAGQSHARPEYRALPADGARLDRADLGPDFRQEWRALHRRPRWSLIRSGTQSGCGAAQAAMGPFYCPTDKQIYIDPTSSTNCRSASGRRATSPRPM